MMKRLLVSTRASGAIFIWTGLLSTAINSICSPLPRICCTFSFIFWTEAGSTSTEGCSCVEVGARRGWLHHIQTVATGELPPRHLGQNTWAGGPLCIAFLLGSKRSLRLFE